MAIPIIYNVRNLLARKLSTFLTIAGVALAVGVLIIVMMLAHGLRYTLVESGSPDNAIVLRKSATSETLSGLGRDTVAVLRTLPEIEIDPAGNPLVAAESVVGVNLLRRGQNNARSGSIITMRGIEPQSLALRPRLSILEGRAPVPGKPEIIAGLNASRGFQGAEVGGAVRMGGIDWQVVGVFEAGGAAFESELWGDGPLLMEAFGREGGYSSLTFRLKDPAADLDAVQARLDADPRLNVEIKRERDYYRASSRSLMMLISILGSVLIVLFSLGAVMGAMVTMFAFVGSRTKEIGTLRALGFSRRSILLCFLIESVLLSLVGGAAASIPALFMQKMTFSTMNLNSMTDLTWSFRASPAILALGLLFALLLGILGGLIPATRAATMPIVSALREE